MGAGEPGRRYDTLTVSSSTKTRSAASSAPGRARATQAVSATPATIHAIANQLPHRIG